MTLLATKVTTADISPRIVRCVGADLHARKHAQEDTSPGHVHIRALNVLDDNKTIQSTPAVPPTRLKYSIPTLLQLRDSTRPIPIVELGFCKELHVDLGLNRPRIPKRHIMDMRASPTCSSEDEGGNEGGVPIKPPYVDRLTGKAVATEPICREPKGPPTGADVIATKEFARFIARHKSPPHVRVTAGGRIVPVGPSSPPQTFHMDFIDRIIQAAEEVEQDPNPQRLIEPVNWFEETSDKDHQARHSKRSAAMQATSKSASSKESSHPQFSKVGSMALPDNLEQVALLADGSKVVRVAGVFYRALVNAEGEPVFVQLTSQKNSVPSSSCKVLSEKPQSHPEQAMEEFHQYFPAREMRDRDSEIAFTNESMGHIPMLVPSHVDLSGNISRDGAITGMPVPQAQHWSIVPYAEGTSDETLHSLTATNRVKSQAEQSQVFPDSARMLFQTLVAPSGMNHPVDNPSSLSQEVISKNIAFLQKLIDEKSALLKSVERWLAKDLESMDESMYRMLVNEKGEQVNGIDRIRKEKEKVIRKLRTAMEKGNPSMNPAAKTAAVEPVHNLQQESLKGRADMAFTRARQQNNPEPELSGGPFLYNGRQTAQDFQTFTPAMHDGRQIVYYPQQRVAPQTQKFPSAQHHKMSQQMSTGCVFDTFSSAAARLQSAAPYGIFDKPVPPSQVDLPDHASSENIKIVNQPDVRRTKTAVSLRHPDGTPIDLEQIRKATQVSNSIGSLKQTSAHHVPASGFGSSFNYPNSGNLDAALANLNAVPFDGTFATAMSTNEVPAGIPIPEINWGRLPDENDDDYHARLDSQRNYQAKYGVVSNRFKKKMPAPIQRPRESPGMYTDENQYFRRPPLPAMVSTEHYQGQAMGARSTTDPEISQSARNAVLSTPTRSDRKPSRREIASGYNTVPVMRFKPNVF